MSSTDNQWQELLDGIRQGDESACQRFWDQYGPMMERVAQRHLSPKVRRRVGPESVLLSACRTFFRRAQGGEFDVPDAESLLGLMCAITVNKARVKIRHHQRQKRDIGSEDHPQQMPDPVDPAWTHVDELEFDEHFQSVVDTFEQRERQVLDLRLQQRSNDEIAQQLNCAERTVRRMIARIQAKLEKMLAG